MNRIFHSLFIVTLTLTVAATGGLGLKTSALAQNAPQQTLPGLPAEQRGSATRVITSYYTFISTGQFGPALDLLGPSFDTNPVRQISAEIRELNSKIATGEVSVSLDRVMVQGDWALAILVIEAELDGKTNTFVADQYLLRIGDNWTVVPKQLRQAEPFSTFFNNNSSLLNNWWNENKDKLHAELVKG